MSNFIYNEAKRLFLSAGVDFTTADTRVILVMTSTTANTEKDVNTIAAFTTLDEYDGSNYTTGGAALASKVVTEDPSNNRAFFDAADLTFSALGAGTRQCKAAIIYKFITNLGLSVPLAYVDTGGFPFSGNGSNVTLQWNAAGLIQMN